MGGDHAAGLRLGRVLADSGLAKTSERRALLMERFKLGHDGACTVALFFGKPVPALDGATPSQPAAASGDPPSPWPS
jgi:hypothetical protein